jgi:hypothetical protein
MADWPSEFRAVALDFEGVFDSLYELDPGYADVWRSLRLTAETLLADGAGDTAAYIAADIAADVFVQLCLGLLNAGVKVRG